MPPAQVPAAPIPAPQAPPQQMPPAQAPVAPMPTQQMPPHQALPQQMHTAQMPLQQFPPSYAPPPASGQPKKKRTGLIVGLSIGGAALLAGLAIGVGSMVNSLNTPEEPPSNVAVTTPVIEAEPTDTPAVEVEPTPQDAPDAEHFVHELIGISFDLVDGWDPEESDKYPDEILGLYHDDPDYPFVWIDRYSFISYDIFVENKEAMLEMYTVGLEGTITEYKLEEDITLNGTPWRHIIFVVTDKYGDLYIDLYITDMPNNRGVFMYAIICPMDKPGQTVFPGYDDAYHMFDTLRFIK